MPSVRNSMTFIAAAALAVVIGMLMHVQHSSNASVHTVLAAVAVKAPPEYWFPRASTHADELVKTNHEGF